jgi:hypothetical protein
VTGPGFLLQIKNGGNSWILQACEKAAEIID